VGNELLHEGSLAASILLAGIVVVTHRAAVVEDIDGGRDLSGAHGLVDELREVDQLALVAGAPAMEQVDDREPGLLVGGLVISRGGMSRRATRERIMIR
jgi:hypothetical protein